MEMSPTAAPLDLGHRKILVVDDDRLSLRILAGVLEGEGCTLVAAGSGEGALLAYAEFLPDLVLLDGMLPGIDGFETCRRLKRSYGENCAPVIFITGKKESDDVLAGLGAGGVDYLPKPFKAKVVLARIRAHLQNRILSEQRKHLVDQLSSANAAKNRLLGMAAHDLRNPLASIRGLAEFLREGAVGPLSVDQLNLINTIHSASQSMLNLVNALLDVATIECGELKLCREPHNLADLIAQSVAMIGLEAAKKNTRVTFDPRGPIPRLMLDAVRLRQVIDNLLSNAVKYSPPGSAISATIQADPLRGTFGFAVQDQGPGIPDNERDQLFKDFSRLSAQPTAGEKSTGLGLVICRKIVEAHGGTITAENLPAGGCEFRVRLSTPA